MQKVTCDRCGADCTAGHVARGIYAPKQYCPPCAQRQDEAEEQARATVAVAAREVEARLKELGVDV